MQPQLLSIVINLLYSLNIGTNNMVKPTRCQLDTIGCFVFASISAYCLHYYNFPILSALNLFGLALYFFKLSPFKALFSLLRSLMAIGINQIKRQVLKPIIKDGRSIISITFLFILTMFIIHKITKFHLQIWNFGFCAFFCFFNLFLCISYCLFWCFCSWHGCLLFSLTQFYPGFCINYSAINSII